MSYISSLNLLNADSPVAINEEVFQEELALWANAQFSFDTTPGSALTEEERKDDTILETLNKLSQLVQPVQQQSTKSYSTVNILPKIAPAPGPLGLSMEQAKLANTKKRSMIEDESEISAEDDKRRRNTAASARFRLKKKLREQALEQKSKELNENVEKLEAKVKELEMEAKWLRALVLEKDPNLLINKKDEE